MSQDQLPAVPPLPTQAENPNGLYRRYDVKKLDGEDDPNAEYLVLRVDFGGDDPEWITACRKAALYLAGLFHTRRPQFSQELTDRYSQLKPPRLPAPRKEEKTDDPEPTPEGRPDGTLLRPAP